MTRKLGFTELSKMVGSKLSVSRPNPTSSHEAWQHLWFLPAWHPLLHFSEEAAHWCTVHVFQVLHMTLADHVPFLTQGDGHVLCSSLIRHTLWSGIYSFPTHSQGSWYFAKTCWGIEPSLCSVTGGKVVRVQSPAGEALLHSSSETSRVLKLESVSPLTQRTSFPNSRKGTVGWGLY